MQPASASGEGVAVIAIGVVRRSFQAAGPCDTRFAAFAPLPAPDLEAVSAAFRRAHGAMIMQHGAGLLLAPPGTVGLTRHERRLLRATAAAQADDTLAMDSHLFNLAPWHSTRASLAAAVAALATMLGGSGHRFTQAALPPPALAVARLHGADLAGFDIAWPGGVDAR